MKAYFKEIIKDSKPTLVVFLHAAEQDEVDVKYLSEAMVAKYGERVNVQKVDSSYNHKIAEEYRISAYPTWILFKEREELMRESGSKTVSELSDMVDRAL